MLDARFEEIHGALVVTPLVQRLDAESAPHLRQTLVPLARDRALVIVCLSEVATVDCSGLAGLVSVLKRLPPGGELRLVSPSASVRALLAATHLDEVLRVFDDAGAALPP